MANSPEPDPTSFRQIERTHDRIDELLLRHQDALVDRDFEACRALFVRFNQEIREHIREEDSLLYPLYQERVQPRPGGGVNLLLAEHRKIERFNEEILAEIDRLPTEPGPARRAVVRLLETEALLKHLLNHHHIREHTFLVPGLDSVTTPQERADLLRRMEELHALPPDEARPGA